MSLLARSRAIAQESESKERCECGHSAVAHHWDHKSDWFGKCDIRACPCTRRRVVATEPKESV